MDIDITVENGNLVVKTPFSWDFVNSIKKDVPSHAKKFDGTRKVWVLDPSYSDWLANVIDKVYGKVVTIPKIQAQDSFVENKVFNILYIGVTKPRSDGSISSYGYNNATKEWDVVFEENILLEWFDLPLTNTRSTTLYAILGIKKTNNKEEIKKAFWRMAKQWHPDHCSEDDAEEQFKKVNNAYQILSNDNLRIRYDAGLALESTLKTQTDSGRFRPPLRCGQITIDAEYKVGRYIVKQIKRWTDITNERGETLVTSWSRYDANFVTRWV